MVRVHAHRALREFTAYAEGALRIAHVGVRVVVQVGEGDERIRRRIARLYGDCGFRQAARRDVAASRQRQHLLAASQQEFVRFDADRPLADKPVPLAARQRQFQRIHDLPRQFVLDVEYVGELAIEPVRPDMSAGHRIDQLRRDPNAVARLPNAALQNVADAERLRHVGHGDRRFFVNKG